MKRNYFSICTRTTVSQQLSDNYEEKLMLFRTYCANKIKDQKIKLKYITNKNEVSLTFDIPVNQTVEITGTSAVSIRTMENEKSSLTTVHGCQTYGQNLSPMIIFNRNLPKKKFSAGVIIKADPKGWMDKEMMNDWLIEVYVKRSDRFFHDLSFSWFMTLCMLI